MDFWKQIQVKLNNLIAMVRGHTGKNWVCLNDVIVLLWSLFRADFGSIAIRSSLHGFRVASF